MCWNADISINTFIFACLALIFIYFANTYTKYKNQTFKNPLIYLFLFEIALMQLLEFFLWRNLKNEKINKMLSMIAPCIILLQQLTLMFMMPNANLKYSMLTIYSIYIIYIIYTFIFINYSKLHTSIGENGHLVWEWMIYKKYDNILLFIALLFYAIPSLAIGNYTLSLFLTLLCILSLIFYFKYNTFGTMWCWSSNLILLYFIVDILLIKPYYEYNGLC